MARIVTNIAGNVTADVHPSKTIMTGMSIYFTMFLMGWIAFEIFQRIWQEIYKARARGGGEYSCPAVERSYGLLGWIWPVLRTSDDDIMEYCGLDALCFLRFLRMGQKLALVGIACSAFLFPYYATGSNPHEGDREDIDPLERITMSNLSQGEGRLWSSVAMMYVMTGVAMYLFVQEFKEYTTRRHEFLGRKGPQQYSVLINDLRKKYCTNQTLSAYMGYLFPGDVHSVHVIKDCPGLQSRVEERIEIRNALEHAMAEFSATRKRPMHKPTVIGLNGLGESVDSITYYEGKLAQLNASIEAEILAMDAQERELANHFTGEKEKEKPGSKDRDTSAGSGDTGEPDGDDDNNGNGTEAETDAEEGFSRSTKGSPKKLKVPMRPSAFISFTTLKSTQTAQQVLQTEDPLGMSILSAPHPKDLVWENIGSTIKERRGWELVSWVSTVLIIFFWTIPTTFVTSLATVEKLEEYIPALKDVFEKNDWMKEGVKQLNPLGLIAMTSLAAYIFGILSRREGHASLSQVNVSHFAKLVYFQTFQIFFVSVIAGTVLESLKEIINEPQVIVSLLGTTMPNQSTLFMTYLMVQIGLKLTLELLRVVPVAIGLIYKIGAPKLTRRERESPWIGLKPASEPGELIQHLRLPDYFLSILLIFAFCAIAPLLCYFAGFFLLASDIIFRRQVLFVYDPADFSTGLYWPKLHNFLVGALFLSQLTFLGLITLKIAPGPIFFATVLPFTTVVYFMWVNSLWPRVARHLPLTHCVRIDEMRKLGPDDMGFLNGAYVQPALAQAGPLSPEENGESGGEFELVSPSTTAENISRDRDPETSAILP